ncbi:MAG: NADH:flavin oxidoreductase [Ginsengibacter sp.]
MRENNLFSSFKIGERILKNRFIVAPMTRASADSMGIPSLKMQAYYHAFANGGFSAIITEGTYTDNVNSQALLLQPGIVSSKQIDAWKGITNKIHQYDCLAICQLMHAGALTDTGQGIAPSAIRPLGLKMTKAGIGCQQYPVPKTMDYKDIKTVVDGFVASARAAQMAGFDGVEIHAANGYLLDQFITPYTNFRTDDYGGSIENSFRIIREILTEIKMVVNAGFVIGLRVSESKVNDLTYRWPDGAGFANELFGKIANCELSYIHIAAEGGNWERECLYADGTSSCSIARELTKLPIIANGGLHDLQEAEKIVETGHSDLIAIGRAAIADPQWVNKIQQGFLPIIFDKGMINPSFNLDNTADFFKRMEN